jgi:hypothetical protein
MDNFRVLIMQKMLDIIRNKLLFRETARFIIIIMITVCAGYASGHMIGTELIKRFVTGRSGLLLLLSRPAYEFVQSASMLNSDSGFKRISGYYSLFENRNIDAAFLIERYRREGDEYIKRTIIWLLGYSDGNPGVLKFLSQEYKTAGESFKRELLKAMKKLSESYYIEFIKDNNVNNKLTDAL